MWDRPRFLGQVPISSGAGFGGSPWEFGGTPSGRYYANQQGTPLMTEQLNSPDNFQEEYHCYQSPAGAFVSIPFGQRDAYLAAGYVAVDSSNCGTQMVAGLRGRRRMGAEAAAQGSPQGGGQGGAQGTPSPASPPGAGFFETRDPFYFPQYPLVAPPQYAPVPPPGTTCAWEKDGNGNDVYVCRQASGMVVTVPPVASYGPVVYPAQSLFSRFY